MDDVTTPATTSRSIQLAAGYSTLTALHMGELCRLAYEGFGTIRALAARPGGRIKAPYGYRQMVKIDAGATQGVILATPRAISVVWRGSAGLGDWRDDFRIARLRWPGVVEGRVHAGFKAQMERARGQLVEGLVDILRQDEYKNAKIFVTGHSLGGVLATLTPLALPKGIHVEAVYSIEAPRLFNETAARDHGRSFGARTHRIVCVHPHGLMDPATRVPPSRPGPWPLGWWHPICVPQIHWAGRGRFTSPEDWEKVRAMFPVSPWQALRVATNLRHSASAHGIDFVVETLAAQHEIEKEPERKPS